MKLRPICCIYCLDAPCATAGRVHFANDISHILANKNKGSTMTAQWQDSDTFRLPKTMPL